MDRSGCVILTSGLLVKTEKNSSIPLDLPYRELTLYKYHPRFGFCGLGVVFFLFMEQSLVAPAKLLAAFWVAKVSF